MLGWRSARRVRGIAPFPGRVAKRLNGSRVRVGPKEASSGAGRVGGALPSACTQRGVWWVRRALVATTCRRDPRVADPNVHVFRGARPLRLAQAPLASHARPRVGSGGRQRVVRPCAHR